MNRHSFPLRLLLATFLVPAVFFTTVSTVSAAIITWGAATDIAGDSDVITTGTLVAAVNVGPTGVAPTTINGVPFSAFSSASLGITTTTSQALSSDYLTLLNSALRVQADVGFTLSMGGLTIGEHYLFQTWVNNSGRNFFAGRGDFPTSVGDGNGNEVELYPGDSGVGMGPGGSNIPPAPGQYVIGTFTADATFQAVDYFSGEIDGVVNGFQLRIAAPAVAPIPEPGTALAGWMLLAMCGFARSRRRGEAAGPK